MILVFSMIGQVTCLNILKSGNEVSDYSGDLKSDPLKTGIIQKPDILEVDFRMVQISNGRISNGWDQSYSYGPDHLKSGQFKMAASIDCCTIYKHNFLYLKMV